MSKPTHLRHTGNGRIFPYSERFAKRRDMEPVVEEGAPVITEAPTPVTEPDAPVTEPTPLATEPDAPVTESTDLATMHHMKLKKLVADNGGEFVSRPDAIAFLNSKGVF